MREKLSSSFCFIFLLTVFLAIVYKIYHLPITHDESWTITRYTPYSIWEIMMYPDSWPNNHILNTILTKLSATILGYSHFSVRLPNLLAFVIYAYSAWKISWLLSNKKKELLFISGVILFFANPYFIEYFGLCRGYGLSNAFLLLSVF